MSETNELEIEYNGREISYKTPLGIYLDGKITGRLHDSIIPRYYEIIANELIRLDKNRIGDIKDDAIRQLNGIGQQDSEEVRQSLRNTIDLTTRLLEH